VTKSVCAHTTVTSTPDYEIPAPKSARAPAARRRRAAPRAARAAGIRVPAGQSLFLIRDRRLSPLHMEDGEVSLTS